MTPDALCRQVVSADHDPFFAPDGEQPAARRVRENEAIAICHMCPALDACKRLAKADPELREHAVIAGLRPTNQRQTRGPRRQFTDAERAEIRTLYATGRSTHDIARRFNTAHDTVSDMCRHLRADRAAALNQEITA